MSRINIIGWALMMLGMLLWAYAYFATGHSPLIDWHAPVPAWVSDFLPNLEAEAGLVLMVMAMIPAYWPKRR